MQQVVVVTGGARGLGKQFCLALAKAAVTCIGENGLQAVAHGL